MLGIFNYNDYLRKELYNYLNSIYNKDYDKFDTMIKYQEYLNDLKNNNEKLYEYLISLMFTDSFAVLVNESKVEELTDNKSELLEILRSINSLDELLFMIDENQELLTSIYLYPISFYKYNKLNKAEILLDEEVKDKLYSFSPLNKLEYESFNTPLNLDDLVILYYDNYNEVSKKETYKEVIFLEVCSNITDELIIRSKTSNKQFKKTIVNMLRNFYVWNKFSEANKNYDILDINTNIINMIEQVNLNEVINKLIANRDLFEWFIEEYITYAIDKEPILRKQIEMFFENKIDEKIKLKLKEV